MLSATAFGAADSGSSFAESIEEKFSTENLAMEDRPQVRWWLDSGYHTEETLRQAVQELYEQGYGGVEILCLDNSSLDNSVYGWGTEEWYEDLLVIADELGKHGMSISFAAGPDWQPTYLYYGTNEDVAGNSSWEDYYEDYEILRENGLDVLETAYEADGYNVYMMEDGTLALDPNVDVFNQGLGVSDAVYVEPGETVSIDLTDYTYGESSADVQQLSIAEEIAEAQEEEAEEESAALEAAAEEAADETDSDDAAVSDEESDAEETAEESADADDESAVDDASEEEDEVELQGTTVSRTKYDVGFENFETMSIAKVVSTEASYTRTHVGVYFDSTTTKDGDGVELSTDDVTQFTDDQLTVGSEDSLITYDEEAGTYTFTWTNTYDFTVALNSSWRVGVGAGTAADTYDYGYMLMVNHFNTGGADAWFAFLKSYILTDEMMEIINKYDMQWDLFIDSLEIASLGNYYWSDEMIDIFYDLNGYDVTPYLSALMSDDYTFENMEDVQNDMQDAMTEAYIIFQERLSDNLATLGGELRAQVSYGSLMTTSSAVRAVDVPETESLAFKFSVESMKLMSGGVHLSGAEEFSSETNNWLGVDNASYNDQIYVVHQQMAAGVNRTVWHGYEAQYSSESVLDWPVNSGGIGTQFGSLNIPTSVLEDNFSEHITRLQAILKTGTERVDVGIMQNDYFKISLVDDGDTKGILTDDNTLQDAGYTWEAFDSSYLWADDGEYGYQNEDGTLGNPQYKAIVVYDEDLSIAAAERLEELVEGGLYVIFLTEDAATVTGSENGTDEELAEIISRIKENTEYVTTVDSTEEIVTALEEFGVTPRLALENAVSDDYNIAMYEECLEETGEGYYTYEGLWTAMMEDEEEGVNYYYVFNESVDYTITTTASFEGYYEAYEMDTWTGEVTAVEDYTYVDGRTELTISLEPEDTTVYVMRKIDSAEDGTEVITSTTDTENGVEILWDEEWEVSIESWTKGDLLTRTETKENIDVYTGLTFLVDGLSTHTTVEYGYDTDKTIVFEGTIANDDLVSWKDMYSAGLSDTDLTAVSGVGTYTTSFTVESWEEGDGIILDLGDIDGMAGVTVNGTEIKVNINNPEVDISSAVVAGENTVVVTVATSVTNYLTNGASSTVRGMQESAPYYPIVYKELPSSYGLTEASLLSSYVTTLAVTDGESDDEESDNTGTGDAAGTDDTSGTDDTAGTDDNAEATNVSASTGTSGSSSAKTGDTSQTAAYLILLFGAAAAAAAAAGCRKRRA